MSAQGRKHPDDLLVQADLRQRATGVRSAGLCWQEQTAGRKLPSRISMEPLLHCPYGRDPSLVPFLQMTQAEGRLELCGDKVQKMSNSTPHAQMLWSSELTCHSPVTPYLEYPFLGCQLLPFFFPPYRFQRKQNFRFNFLNIISSSNTASLTERNGTHSDEHEDQWMFSSTLRIYYKWLCSKFWNGFVSVSVYIEMYLCTYTKAKITWIFYFIPCWQPTHTSSIGPIYIYLYIYPCYSDSL